MYRHRAQRLHCGREIELASLHRYRYSHEFGSNSFITVQYHAGDLTELDTFSTRVLQDLRATPRFGCLQAEAGFLPASGVLPEMAKEGVTTR
jgi:hypothetical protein